MNYIEELQNNNDVTLIKSLEVLEKRIKSLKKRNIPDRLRRLLTILDQCDIGMVNGYLSTSGMVLSAFVYELDALREAFFNISYLPRDNKHILADACLRYRLKKYRHAK